MKYRACLLVIALVGALFGPCLTVACERHEKAREFLAVSGAQAKFEKILRMMHGACDTDFGLDDTDHISDLMHNIIDETLSTERLNDLIANNIAKALTVEELTQLIKWYVSETGQKLIQSEDSMMAADAMRVVFAEQEALLKTHEGRLEFAKKVIERTDYQHFSTNLHSLMALLVYLKMGKGAPAFSAEQLIDVEQFQGFAQALVLKIVASFTDEELSDMESLIERSAFKTAKSITVGVLVDAFAEAAATIKARLYEEADSASSDNGQSSVNQASACCCAH